MKVVMISAPYSSVSAEDRAEIKRVVEITAMLLWANSIATIVPHLNSWKFTLHKNGEEDFYNGYLEIARRCDAIFVLYPGRNAKGVFMEITVARKVFTDIKALLLWAKKSEEEKGGLEEERAYKTSFGSN